MLFKAIKHGASVVENGSRKAVQEAPSYHGKAGGNLSSREPSVVALLQALQRRQGILIETWCKAESSPGAGDGAGGYTNRVSEVVEWAHIEAVLAQLAARPQELQAPVIAYEAIDENPLTLNDYGRRCYDAGKKAGLIAARYPRPDESPAPYGSEILCESCAAVFCPHGERLHFHHDGCPACAEVELAARPPSGEK